MTGAGPLVLASGSPRRRDLLARAGFTFEIDAADVREISDCVGPPVAVATRNSELKAMSVATRRPQSVVLGADTIVVAAGRIFGKPTDLDDARRMLSHLSGRVHEVITAVRIVRWEERQVVLFSESTRVRFRSLDRFQIDDYLRSIHPFDKAGSYAAQDDQGRLIAQIEGSLSNVIGLPVERVAESLALHFDIHPS